MEERSTILIVDDDRSAREALKGALLAPEYILLFAENGPKGIQMAQEYTPDLILLDVMMPGMDGFQVCLKLRANPLLREIPVVLVTALDDRDSRLLGIESGADDFLTKPFDRVELRARVKTITRLNRYRRLLLERARFAWVVENDRDGYMILDPDGTITYANTAARTLFSLPPDSNPPQPIHWSEIWSHYRPTPPEAWEQWPRVQRINQPLFLLRPQDEQNNPTWLEVRLLNLPWGQKTQFLARIQDVSTRMAESLEIWSFQTAACHKLVTPLSNLLLSTELIEYLSRGQETAEFQELARAIQKGARRLEGEIKDVLQYIHAPNLMAAGGPFALRGLRPLFDLTARELGLEKAIQISAIPDPLYHRQIHLSERALQTIIWEALENARKFHPTLSPQIEIGISQETQNLLLFTIADDGLNLPADQLKLALQPYYQGERLFTGQIEGMGLGLSTIATLVWQSGGDVHLYNRPDGPGIMLEMQLPLLPEI